jgi:electron transfer flavoprotein beta subunit
MKIVVCFKVLPDFDQVVDADWDNFSLSTDLGYVKRIFGCFDESALETALRLRSAWIAEGEQAECHALTAAPLPSLFCKTLFAAGFDRVLDLSGAFAAEAPSSSPEFRPRRMAAVLGNYLVSAGYDLILAGRQAGYADTGTVPLFLAEFLEIPVITGIEEISPCPGGVEVKRTGDTGRERLRVRLPLAGVLGNSPVSALRAATLGARMAASKRDAERPDLSSAGDAAAGKGRRDRPDFAEGTGEDRGAEAPRFSRELRHKTCRFLLGGAGLAESVAGIRAEYLRGWER